MTLVRTERLGWWAGGAGLAVIGFAALWALMGQVHRDVHNIATGWTSWLEYALIVGGWFLFLVALFLIGSPDAEVGA